MISQKQFEEERRQLMTMMAEHEVSHALLKARVEVAIKRKAVVDLDALEAEIDASAARGHELVMRSLRLTRQVIATMEAEIERAKRRA